jgi:sulfur dioxygenase
MMSSAMLFRQLFDEGSSTFTYLLADLESREAVIIDAVYEKYTRDLALIQELDLKLLACLETHCHADHVTAAWLFKNSQGSQIVASVHSGIEVLDQQIGAGDAIQFGRFHLKVIATPGHTDGCVSFLLDDLTMVFTGDSLLIRGCGRTDFQQGSARDLYQSITEGLFSLPDDCLVYPAHDYAGRTASSIGEEKHFNPRIGGQANENDFVGYMENMQLPHPKKLDIAVPANLKGGRPEESQLPKEPDWAPVVATYGGILEITPQWVAAHRSQVHILDVRTRVETGEENAKVAGAQLIPIDELRDRLSEVPRDLPVMTICRSGKRSVLAFSILKDAGWKEVANIQGGLLGWQKEGLPIDQLRQS